MGESWCGELRCVAVAVCGSCSVGECHCRGETHCVVVLVVTKPEVIAF